MATNLTMNPRKFKKLYKTTILLLSFLSVIALKHIYAEKIFVKRVIDGDTIRLVDGERLRYIGVDTPELDHYNMKVREMAQIAKKFNEGLVEEKELSLEYDVAKRDRYGRLLAYVFLKDGTFVNAELVKQGYAMIMTVPPNVKYANFFLKLQKEARQAKRGLWTDEYADVRNLQKRRRK